MADNNNFGELIHGLKMSEQINELASAMSKCQAKVGIAHRNKANPFFSSKYADLESVVDAFREPMSDNGLSLIQFPSFKDGWVYLTSILMHQSGQFVRATMGARPVLNFDKKANKYEEFPSPQSLGSCIKYLRRYTQESIFNVPTTDDDGNDASNKVDRNDHKPAQRTEPKQEQKPLPKEAADTIGWERIKEELAAAGVPNGDAKLANQVIMYVTNGKVTLAKAFGDSGACGDALEAICKANVEFPPNSKDNLLSIVKEKAA
jgi:hypothetical protein